MRKVTLEEYKAIILGVLEEIDRICRQEGFTYMLGCGTLLGAVRHQGFIPWDDDIDIMMPRQDYYRLMDYMSHHETGLAFFDVTNKKDTIFVCGKICRKGTTVKENHFREVEGYGAFVDVFILDDLPDDEKQRKSLIRKNRLLRKLVVHSARTTFDKGRNPLETGKRLAAFGLSRFFNTQDLIRRLNQGYLKAFHGPCHYVGISGSVCDFRKEDVATTVDAPFEGRMFQIPVHAEAVLENFFGDYRTLPPEDQRVPKHNIECFVSEDEAHGCGAEVLTENAR